MATFDGEDFTFASFSPYGYAEVWDRFWTKVLNELTARATAMGAAIPAYVAAWDAGTADADPGAGKLRINAATAAAATQLFSSATDGLGNDVSALIAQLGASTSAVKGLLRIGHRTDQTRWAIYSVTGPVTVSGSYRKVPLLYLAGPGGFSAADPVAVGFVRNGDKGDQGNAGTAASDTVAGVVELATTAETAAGADPTRAVTPAGAAASYLGQGRRSAWVPATAMRGRGTNGAATGTVETSANKVMRLTLDFDTATQEYAQFSVAMPKSWDRGTVSFVAYWTAASGSGGVAWSLQAVAVSDDDPTDAAFGTAQTVTDTFITAGDLHVTAESSAITVAGSPAVGDLIWFQVSRQVANAADTLAVDACLIGIKLIYNLASKDDA